MLSNDFLFLFYFQVKRCDDDDDHPEKCTICLCEFEEGEDVR